MRAERDDFSGESPTAGPVRLQKFLSDAGVASRRHAEAMILEGRVLVNDRVIEALPAFVDPRHDRVIVDGAAVKVCAPEYWLLNKPKGVVCTNRDPSGRRRAVDFLPDGAPRLFVVGRLEAESGGLLLLTNDGELALRITHPRYGIPKIYRVEVKGQVAPDLPEQLKRGVYLFEGRASASEVEVLHRNRDRSALDITLREGTNRQIRRMFAKLGHKVARLTRTHIGPLSLKGLPIGGCRRLFPEELGELKRAASRADARAKTAAPPPRRQRRTGFDRGPRRPAASTAAPRATTRPGKKAPSSAAPRRRIIQ